ncbi:MAG TPA: ATP-binding protein [Opitutaceae bacterium]|jgi:hypothetical protein|nr:ATP-binding protein [Opitutaceae bacterium]
MDSVPVSAPEAFRGSEVVELRHRLKGHVRLVAAVQELSLARSLAAVQAVVRRAARELVGADGATFVLREGDACHYADEDAISPLWKGQRFPMAACISGWVMLNARAAMIPDIYTDPRIPADAYRPTFVKSLVMVPIRQKSPIGAIGVYWAAARISSAEEIALLQGLADTTSVALENVQVYAELEARVARRTEQWEALNRELEAFSFSVSHDLKAPLRAVDGFIDLLVRELGDGASERAREYASQVRLGSARMRGLIEDLLRLARVARQPLRRGPVDLAVLGRDILQRLQADSPDRSVEIVIAPALPAHADGALIGVVLENLLSNAWKYSGRTPQARIELGTAEEPGQARHYFVKDNGAGFDPKRVGELFTPFQRLHAPSDFPGTGVGLATAQRVIHRHGGRIWATAEPNQGATFCFTLPGQD